MASDIVTLKDHDLRSLIEQLSESRAAVAELVEVLGNIKRNAARKDITAQTALAGITMMADLAISRHQAGLGKGEGG